MALDDVFAIAQKHLHHTKRTGNQNVMAVCPFHLKDGRPEKNPSFCLSLISGLWICFSCKKTGNLEHLLRAVGVSGATIQAQYKYVLEEAAEHRRPAFDPLRPQVLSDDPLPESFLGLFDLCPVTLLEEGFTKETLAQFDVGFDEVHQRITYPLRDLRGNLVGIAGRSTEYGGPRYKVYDKEYTAWQLPGRNGLEDRRAALLWNAHHVYQEVFHSRAGSVVLVEGFKACMWLVQAGVRHVVALMGSYMSSPQRWALERMGATVYIMLDNDEAGQLALRGEAAQEDKYAVPGIAKVLSESLPVRVVTYDAQKKQPSDLAEEEVTEALRCAKDYHLWAIEGA